MLKLKPVLPVPALTIAIILLLSAMAQAASDTVYNFSMSGGYMTQHPTVQNAFIPWAKRIKQRTGGKVNITYFDPNTLGAESESFEMVRKGQLDIGHSTFARNPGRLLISTVADIPNAVTHPPAASVAMWRMYNEIPEIKKEYDGVKLLAVHSSAPTQFNWVVDEDITKVSQVKGKKLLVTGGEPARMARSMGGSPLIVPVADFHLSLSRNMSDGCVLPIAPLRSFKISDSLKTITVNNLSVSGWWIAMSLTAWNSLPPEYQKIIEEESGEKLSYMGGRSVWDGDQQDMLALEKSGIRLNRVSQADRKEWLKIATPPYKDEWFKKMNQRKLPAQRIFDTAMGIYQECANIDVLPYSYLE